MISHYASRIILNGICGKTNSAPSYLAYLALSSTEPQKDGTGVTEPIGNGYERKLIGNYAQTMTQMMGEPNEGVIENDEEIHFLSATGSWGELKYVCIYTAKENGNLVAWGILGETVDGEWQEKSISPVADTVVVIRKGDLKISIE